MADVTGEKKDTNTCGSTSQHVEIRADSDTCSNGESKSNDDEAECGPSKNCSFVKATPFKNNFSFRSSLLDSSSKDSLSSTPKKPFILNPSRLSTPFSKSDKTEDNKDEKNTEALGTPKKSEDLGASLSTPLKTSGSGLSFVPLGGEPSTPASGSTTFSASSTPALGFVFGQNIHEKVESTPTVESGRVASPEPSSTSSDTTTPPPKVAEVTSNGTSSEMLFSVGLKKETPDKASEANKSLSEAAREYEEARAVKRKFEEVPVLTGEEEEANVLQINCKLFSWSSCSWTERGRGTLRVNDLPTSPPSHRLIVRTAGSLRVVLNTKIWSGMTIDRASVKSMRLTGMDSNAVVKVFLVMASPKEMDQLQKCLEWRVSNLRKLEDGTPKKSKVDDS